MMEFVPPLWLLTNFLLTFTRFALVYPIISFSRALNTNPLELAFLAIDPNIKVIAPWRVPEFYNRFQGRNDLLDYAAATGIPVTSTKAKPYSMDDNIAHCSYEAGALEDPALPAPDDMWTRTVDPVKALDKPVDISISFKQGLPVALHVGDKVYTDSLELFIALNEIGKQAGIGRIDIVEVSRSSFWFRTAADSRRTASSDSRAVAATTRPP